MSNTKYDTLTIKWLHSQMPKDFHPDKNIEYRIARLVEAFNAQSPVTGTEGKTLEECKEFCWKWIHENDYVDAPRLDWDDVWHILKDFSEAYAKQHTQRVTEAAIIHLAKSCLFLGRRGYSNIQSDEDCWKDFMSRPENVELLTQAGVTTEPSGNSEQLK